MKAFKTTVNISKHYTFENCPAFFWRKKMMTISRHKLFLLVMNVRNTIIFVSLFVCLQRCGPKKSAIEKFMELYGEKTGIVNM